MVAKTWWRADQAALASQVSGHPAIAPHLEKFYGIRNGIDQEIWDPLFDRFLPRSGSIPLDSQLMADSLRAWLRGSWQSKKCR